jgi:hypothetical protein
MALGYRRVAGMQLSISHFRSAGVGDTVLTRGHPCPQRFICSLSVLSIV